MHKLLFLTKLWEMKIVFLDEAVFTYNTLSKKAWSSAYTSIKVKDSNIRIKTQALIAAISEDVGLESYMIHPRSIKTEQFVAFLEQLSERFDRKPFAVFLDNL